MPDKGIHAAAPLLAALVAALFPGPAAGQDDERPEAALEGLDFRSHFCVNLHHFLYLQGIAARNSGRVGEAPEDWMRAVEFYRSAMIERDLLFDPEMRRVDELLGEVRSLDELADLELPAGLAAVLADAAPLYQQRFWPGHDARNRQWMEGVLPLLREHGTAVANRLCEVLQADWPERVVVDVLAYANWAGAYTTSNPAHMRIGTRFPVVEAPHEAFETVFHEASHLLIDGIAERLRDLARADEVAPPRDLWHALLFFTVGELARASPATPEGYVPYAERHGLYEKSPAWTRAREALREHWAPYLDGERPLEEALAALVAAFPAGPEPEVEDAEK